MKISIPGKEIEFKKEQNKCDRFVIELMSVMDKLNRKLKTQTIFLKLYIR